MKYMENRNLINSSISTGVSSARVAALSKSKDRRFNMRKPSFDMPRIKAPSFSIRHKGTLTNIALALIVIISLYLILAPLAPSLNYYLNSLTGKEYDNRANDDGGEEQGRDYQLSLKGKNQQSDYYKDDIVLIPSIGVDMDIVEGTTDKALDKGAWIRPNGSTPNKGSNTILTAHRFSYLDGGRSFYHLDKVQAGDEIIVYWKGDRYRYIAKDSKVVRPSAVEVEDSSSEPILTLYTCTPLWTAANRLVITAVPDEPTINLIAKRASR
ncbi:MAG: class E sortase [Candidatus Dojkabacteria bacterium]|nr:MAG: class E sortase [Candidatus Dojkabacteria bacterium]